jgi:site-specific recombinase XerD
MDSNAGGAIAVVEGPGAGAPLVPAERIRAEADAARGYAANEKAEATRRAYRSDWSIFSAWCAARSAAALPALPETVAAFLAAEADAGAKPSTIARRAAAIRYAHALAGHEPPTGTEAVKATIRGIRRARGTAPAQKAPATAARIAEMIATIPAETLRGRRDRALLLLGFAGAFRRSELVALRVEDLAETPEGLRVIIRRSKTDQEGGGHEIAIPRGARLRPVEALRAWLAAAGITDGPVFRRLGKGRRVLAEALAPEAVADVVKARAAAVGLAAEDFAGHSLRAGFLTSGAEAGASIFKLMEVSRHKSVDTLCGYVRRAELFKDHAGSGFL